jgi:chitodextrinase
MLGNFNVTLRDEFGNPKAVRAVDNVFTAVGKAHVADQLQETPSEDPMSHMAIGTDDTALTAGDTTLGTELDRNALTSFVQGTGANTNKVIYTGDWEAGDGTGAITEAGIFNSSTVGTMLCASTFSVINKGESDTLSIEWTVTVG